MAGGSWRAWTSGIFLLKGGIMEQEVKKAAGVETETTDDELKNLESTCKRPSKERMDFYNAERNRDKLLYVIESLRVMDSYELSEGGLGATALNGLAIILEEIHLETEEAFMRYEALYKAGQGEGAA